MQSAYGISRFYRSPKYKIEIIGIRGANSMTEGYNNGLKKTDAKYKIYLHQDVMIIHHMMLYNMLEIFLHSPKVGMLGVVGCEHLNDQGLWWDSPNRFGKVLEDKGYYVMSVLHEPTSHYQSVEAIDGLIIMTQYDLEWESSVFDHWHFYDISQCEKFKAHGYEIGVPQQGYPWVIHECGPIINMDRYEEYRLKFLDWKNNFYSSSARSFFAYWIAGTARASNPSINTTTPSHANDV
ncbi:glycosyltransferase family protein [Geomicrobium sp. JCM 19038]|uniref:glycosyltransferase family protein n=1 Tax=Geomicrobium sp. JCM 19038 TaxID=1460635 RepID=UPI0009DF9EC9|nr:glycosyltransferase family protein [Geomicrobium sp. JCM 19038]